MYYFSKIGLKKFLFYFYYLVSVFIFYLNILWYIFRSKEPSIVLLSLIIIVLNHQVVLVYNKDISPNKEF